ncbi:phosphoglycerate mutase [Arenimonas caeni]|uniref:phosphoglycerate mutase n=1 Tax=Arenimonas caeni TaxID=2058085 RepID=UPI002A35ADA7|nr:phosphoglycerate mutase [Arenimonas caeni]MDY0020930.1 phosphoglycerate mutase [Arenimonas caeni]
MADAPAGPAIALLLPERRRFAGQAPSPAVARLLGRADALPPAQAGERAQLQRWFELLPRGWPVAAITRQHDAGDAGLHAWLRADPAYVRPDMTGARVLAIGELGLTPAEAEALVQPLRPLFGDAGFPISAPVPSRWYLALPVDARLPDFAPPEAVLGDDLFLHLPDGPEGRRWRALLNEAQVLLHNHPVNQTRVAAGKPPVNSLCFWGAGRLPDHVRARLRTVATDEPTLAALARLAQANPGTGEGRLLDLRHLREWSAVEPRLVEALAQAGEAGLMLDFADGAGWWLRAGQRWRFWRRPLAALA